MAMAAARKDGMVDKAMYRWNDSQLPNLPLLHTLAKATLKSITESLPLSGLFSGRYLPISDCILFYPIFTNLGESWIFITTKCLRSIFKSLLAFWKMDLRQYPTPLLFRSDMMR